MPVSEESSARRPGRPQKPVRAAAGPLRAFAEDLRALRAAAGNPTYEQMAERALYSKGALARVDTGKELPSWNVTRAYVRACHGDEIVWKARWNRTKEALDDPWSDHEPPPPDAPADAGPRGAAAGPARLAPPELAEVTEALAAAVARQWRAELNLRRIHDPHPLPVRWEQADPEVVEDWDLVTRSLRHPMAAPRLAGGDDEIADVFEVIPTRRLVVLGEPGSGKTILLVRLVLDLLERRTPGTPVPVLLPVASWNPTAQRLRSWLTGRLIADYPGLAKRLATPVATGRGRRGARAVDALLDAGLLLPLLDGLDEIPDAVRGPALAEINSTLSPGDGLVVSCRARQYREAVYAGTGTPTRLWAACGITLREVDPAAVETFLRRDAGPSQARWRPVFAVLGTAAPVAEALRTPLMVSLARTIYNPRPGEHADRLPDPAELCDEDTYATARDVRNHLFDAYLAAAYRNAAPLSAPSADRPTYTAEQARRWLTFLAVHLRDNLGGTTDLRWWEIPRAAPRALAGVAVGLVAGLAAGLVAATTPRLGSGLGIGMFVALAVALPLRRAVAGIRPASAVPRRLRGLLPRLVSGLLGGAAGGLLGGAAGGIGLGTAHGPLSGIAGALAVGLAVGTSGGLVGGAVGGFAGGLATAMTAGLGHGLIAGLVDGPAIACGVGFAVGYGQAAVPAARLRWSAAGLLGGSVIGIVVGLGTYAVAGAGLVSGVVAGLTSGLAAGLTTGLGRMPADLEHAATPRALYGRDRATWIVATSVIGVVMVFGTWVPSGYAVSLGAAITGALSIALAAGFLQACWGTFGLARIWLALGGRLPWRLMTFLADAHENRGVLRQAGALYQFRHAEFQRRLAPARSPGRANGVGAGFSRDNPEPSTNP
jgi:hypothetical protein